MRTFSAVLALLPVLSLHAAPADAQRAPNDPAAVALIARAVNRMGGEQTLRGIRTIRMDVMTQWQRTALGEHPYADVPSFERHTDLRDYAVNAWRNTRTFLPAGGSVDIVRDSIGARTLSFGGRVSEMPLNVAYVDERRELWAFAPERTLLAARDAGGLRLATDTSIDGVKHARISTSVDGFPATWFLRRTDGLPALVRFRADETNDFGLAPWGMMEVEIWYSGWTSVAPGLLLPRQRDVRRVGRPYKRMTALAMAVNVPAPVDSFPIADSLARAYLSRERRPMWAVPLDSARIVDAYFATFPPFVGVSGAVRIGGQWVLLETGQAPGAGQAVSEWLARQAPGSKVGAAVVTNTTTSNGGVGWFAAQKVAVQVAPGAEPLVRQVLAGAGVAGRRAPGAVVRRPHWLRVGTDSLWLEPVDLPDMPGTMMVYSPTHRWLYSAAGVGRPVTQVEQDAVVGRLGARGLRVEWIGNARTFHAPLRGSP
jgi:hypothetical protein